MLSAQCFVNAIQRRVTTNHYFTWLNLPCMFSEIPLKCPIRKALTKANKQNLQQILLAGGTNKRKRVAKQCRENVEFEVRKDINILADTAAKSAWRRIKDNRGNDLPRQ